MNLERLGSLHYLFVMGTYKNIGGAETQAMRLAVYIKTTLGAKVSFIATEQGEAFKNELQQLGFHTELHVFNHGASKVQKVLSYPGLIRHLRVLKPDVLIPYVAESNKIVAQIWRYTGATFSFWNQRDEGRKLYGTSNEKSIIRKVSSIVSNSYEGRDALVKVYGLESDQIHVINNGIISHDEPIKRTDLRKDYDLKTTRPLVTMVANITPRKDHETLLIAWAKVMKHCEEKGQIKPLLVLAGWLGKTFDALRLLAFDLNLSNDIKFLGAVKPIQPLIEESEFCVFSSNLEGCPNGVLEAMERHKVVIGTNISGIRQALGERYSEYVLSEPNSPEDLASKIIGIMNNPELSNQISSYNKTRISQEFSIDKMGQSYLELIDKYFSIK